MNLVTSERALIRDRIVCGVISQQLKERMLREVDLTLENALALARADETTKKQMKQMNAATSSESVDNLHNKSKSPISNRKSQKTGTNYPTRAEQNQHNQKEKKNPNQKCTRCGYEQPPRKCPAYGQKCSKCKKMNRYSKFCKSIQEIEDIPPSDDSDYQIDSFTINGEDKERT